MNKDQLREKIHILVSRSEQVYWYLNKDEEYDLLSLGISINRQLGSYNEDLTYDRSGIVLFQDLPRDYDIIFVYEILDFNEFFDVVRGNRLIEVRKHLQNGYKFKPFVKLLWERI